MEEEVTPEGETTTDEAAPVVEAPKGEERQDVDRPVEGPARAGEHLGPGLAELHGELAELRRAFEDRLAYDRFKEVQIDRLHQELQGYKEDLLARTARPLLLGVIRLHGDLGRTVSSLRGRPVEELTQDRFFEALDGLRDDVELLLEGHGVERFEAVEESFDPARQTALRTVESADPDRVGRIALRLRPGFLQGKCLLQREGVAVYVAAAIPAEPNLGGDLE